MKRFLVSVLAILVLLANTGLNLHMHYCMGHLVGIGLSEHSKETPCRKCGMTKSSDQDGCCRDVQKLVKDDEAKTVHSTPSKADITDPLFSPSSNLFDPWVEACSLPRDIYFSLIAAPPDIGIDCPKYITYRSLLI